MQPPNVIYLNDIISHLHANEMKRNDNIKYLFVIVIFNVKYYTIERVQLQLQLQSSDNIYYLHALNSEVSLRFLLIFLSFELNCNCKRQKHENEKVNRCQVIENYVLKGRLDRNR